MDDDIHIAPYLTFKFYIDIGDVSLVVVVGINADFNNEYG